MVKACPRCDSTSTRKVADSPVTGKFEVYSCTDCNYVWRSTENTSRVIKKVPYWKEHSLKLWEDVKTQ